MYSYWVVVPFSYSSLLYSITVQKIGKLEETVAIPSKSSKWVLMKRKSLYGLLFWANTAYMAYVEFFTSFTVAAVDIFGFFSDTIQTLKFGLQK